VELELCMTRMEKTRNADKISIPELEEEKRPL
jgi:hypothetical protein